MNTKREDLLHPELSYKIVGILFEVYNEIGPGYREKHYEKAVAVAFENAHIRYKTQLHIPLTFQGKTIRKDFLDFLVEEKIILELKQGDRVSKKHFEQVSEYLQATNLKLGIIALFSPSSLKFKRVVNNVV